MLTAASRACAKRNRQVAASNISRSSVGGSSDRAPLSAARRRRMRPEGKPRALGPATRRVNKMGNSSSGISIHINPSQGAHANGAHLAGSVITGTVYAAVPTGNSLDPADVGLSVAFSGKEDVKVRYRKNKGYKDSKGNSKTKQITKYEYASRNIVYLSVPLGLAGSSLEAGRYAFPFELRVPEQIPTSMDHSGDGGYCRIVYEMEARANMRWSGKHLAVQVHILAEPPSSEPIGSCTEPVTEQIRCCCCIPRGEIAFAAKVDDTRQGRGGRVRVDFACKNTSAAEIQCVEASIREHRWWRAGRHTSVTDRVIVRDFQKTRNMDRSTEQERKDYNSSASNGAPRDGLFREVLQKMRDGKSKIQLDIPRNTNHTYSGSIIGVSHTLNIKMITRGSTDLSREIHLAIVTQSDAAGVSDDVNGSNDAAPSAPSAPLPAPSAPSVPAGWDATEIIYAPPACIPFSASVFGGTAVSGDTEEEWEVDPSVGLPEDSWGAPAPVSLPVLLEKIGASVSARSSIRELLQEDAWHARVFRQLTPHDLAQIVGWVTMDFYQVDVAAALAPAIDRFTADHVVHLLRTVADWIRISIVHRLLPLCKDLSIHAGVVRAELTDWERINTERDFERALAGGTASSFISPGQECFTAVDARGYGTF